MNEMVVTLLSRPGCCLCERALKVLQRLQAEFRFEIKVVNISSSDDLELRYGIHIPVGLLAGREVFRYEIDETKFRGVLKGVALDGNRKGSILGSP